tara:strand:+ start:4203 stop:5471 length:1269 start_codon:yes stop_codon:yes gene_type:complete
MKKLLLILFLLPYYSISQNFPIYLRDTNGGGSLNWVELPQSIIEDIDNNYVYCGSMFDFNNFSQTITLNKLTSNGIFVWSKNFNVGEAVEVINSSSGGYTILGEVPGTSSDDDDIIVIKVDQNGNEEWNKVFGVIGGDEDPRAIIETSDGGYIICTDSKLNQGAKDHVSVLKLDYLGNLEWSNDYGVGGNNDSRTTSSIQQTFDGGYIFSVDNSIYKVDSNGQIEWQNNYGFNLTYDGDIKIDNNGDYIICGEKQDQNNFSYDICLIKINSIGNEIWRKYIGGPEDEYCAELHTTSDGGIILFAETEINGDEEIYVLKTDNNGNQEWDYTWGVLGEDFSTSGLQMFNNEFILCGVLEDFGSGIIIRLDENGSATSTFNISLNSNRKLKKTVDILGKQIKSKTNKPLFYIYDDGTVDKIITID